MSSSLIRYWFEFDIDTSPEARITPRVGVTGLSADDARSIMSQKLFGGATLPPIRRMVEDVDIRDLDAKHVVNQMAPPNRRGIWYPRGYES